MGHVDACGPSACPARFRTTSCEWTNGPHADPKACQRALGLPDAESAIVVLVDGLGYWNLAMRLGHAPYLRSLMNESANQRPIATCAPSTTVAAMAAFGTGTCPGLTAMAGYTQLEPASHKLIQLIQFKDALAPKPANPHIPVPPMVDPLDLQREETVFEKATQYAPMSYR